MSLFDLFLFSPLQCPQPSPLQRQSLLLEQDTASLPLQPPPSRNLTNWASVQSPSLSRLSRAAPAVPWWLSHLQRATPFSTTRARTAWPARTPPTQARHSWLSWTLLWEWPRRPSTSWQSSTHWNTQRTTTRSSLTPTGVKPQATAAQTLSQAHPKDSNSSRHHSPPPRSKAPRSNLKHDSPLAH